MDNAPRSSRPSGAFGPAGFERVAHRGSPRERKENTLPGFLLAVEHGADAVELDVHVTTDAVVVVHHDPTARDHPIAATPWRELAQLDLGGGSRIPRLEDVLRSLGNRATVYIELKGEAIEDAVIDVARRHGREYALHSFDHDMIARVAKRAPAIPRGVLLDKDGGKATERLRRAVEQTKPRDVWPHWTLVDREFIRVAQQLDVRVIAWTVNSVETARSLVAFNVDGICTDDVRLLANL